MNKPPILAVLSLLLLSMGSPAAVTGLGGLEAVALSPDGKLVAVGGQNRVIYLIDAGTLTVKKRLWVGARIGVLAFDTSGKGLIVEDETDRLRLLAVATGKESAKVEGVSGMIVSRRAGLVAVLDRGAVEKPRLRLLSLADLSDKGRIELPDRPSAWTFDATGKHLVVLGKGILGDEKRIAIVDTPATLRGLEREAFRQQHDGYESYLRTIEVGTGKMIRVVKLWYTSDSDSTTLVQSGTTTFILNRSNLCARIAGDGKTTLFQTQLRFNQGIGASEDGRYLVVGGMGEGTHGSPEKGRLVRFQIDPLVGQAELFARFTVSANGSAYGVTTGFRLVRLSREGRVEKVAPIY